MGEVVLVV